MRKGWKTTVSGEWVSFVEGFGLWTLEWMVWHGEGRVVEFE